MSDVQEVANVSLVLADFAVADQLGKLQIIGGGLQIIGRDHTTGTSAPFALVVTAVFPPEVFNEQFAFEVTLEDADGTPLQLGSPLMANGGPPSESTDVMRFAQNQQVDEPVFRGAQVPRRALPARHQMVLHFNTGLPLPAGQVLVWRVRIDGSTKPEWTLRFFVANPVGGPVIG